MKKLLVLAALLVGFSVTINAQPIFELPNSLLKECYNDNLYLDGSELRTTICYMPVCVVNGGGTLLRSTVEIYKDGRKERTLTSPKSFFLYHIIGERFYYDVFVTVYTREGDIYTAHYTAYNSGLQLP